MKKRKKKTVKKKKVDTALQAALEVLSLFEDPVNWQRSKKGNLWREWEGLNITVCEREGYETFYYVIADSDGPEYSNESYDSEEEAVSGVAHALSVGEDLL